MGNGLMHGTSLAGCGEDDLTPATAPCHQRNSIEKYTMFTTIMTAHISFQLHASTLSIFAMNMSNRHS
jgi:hypothetical protein